MAFVRYDFKPHNLEMEGVKEAKMQVLIGEEEGAPNYIMRRFRIEIGGHTLKHKHDYEHMAFVLSGLGTLFASDKEFKLKKGTSLLVHSNELHQFRADRGKHLEFLCLIPK